MRAGEPTCFTNHGVDRGGARRITCRSRRFARGSAASAFTGARSFTRSITISRSCAVASGGGPVEAAPGLSGHKG